jgi:hypothetical protein
MSKGRLFFLKIHHARFRARAGVGFSAFFLSSLAAR